VWNWKFMHEDDKFVLYCDIDNVTVPEADEDGFYPSTDCYQAMPERVAMWVSVFPKGQEAKDRYLAQRESMGLETRGYEAYHHTLCLAEFDARRMVYRFIPAVDYTEKEDELGTSAILSDEGRPLLKGIKAEWSAIGDQENHSVIQRLFDFLFPPER
jgi:hypothetical protein